MNSGHIVSSVFDGLRQHYWLSPLLGALGVVLFTVAVKLYCALTSPLRRIPGPWSARFSRLWFLRQAWVGRYHLEDIKLHAKHGMCNSHTRTNNKPLMPHTFFLGAIVRIAPNEYSLDDPTAVQLLYGSKAGFTKV